MNLDFLDIISSIIVVAVCVCMCVRVFILRRKINEQKSISRAYKRYLHLAHISEEHVSDSQLQKAKANAELAIRKGNGINNFGKGIEPMLDFVINSTKRIIESGISDEERHELGLAISRRVKKLSDVVENVLLMARIDSKRIRYSNDRIKVADLIGDIYSEYSAQDGSRYSTKDSDGCKLGLIEGRSSLCITADHIYITKAIREVVKNAFTFSHSGDILIGWFYRLGTDEVEIFVEDNGIGIKQENLPHIFDVFYKENDTPGLGIGLSLTKDLVEGMGGRIELASRHEVGTRVSILFPMS